MVFLDIEHQTSEAPTWDKISSTAHSDAERCCQEHHWELPAFYQTIWAIVLNRFTGSQCVTFAVNTADNNRLLQLCESTIDLETSMVELMGCQHPTISNLTNADLNCETGVLFDLRDGESFNGNEFRSPLQTVLCIESSGVSLLHSSSMPSWHAQNLISTVQRAIEEIVQHPGQLIKNLDLFSDRNQVQLSQWHEQPPVEKLAPMVETIQRHASERPTHQAICAWDGTLTYAELDNVSTQLAHRLLALGVGKGDMVLLGFEKSMYTHVALVAILKVGAIFVPVSPKYPMPRIQAIVDATNPRLAFTSAEFTSVFERVLVQTVALDSTYVQNLPTTDQFTRTLPSITLDQTAFVIFTSGSTGKPKGCDSPHRALAAMINQGPAFEMHPSSRVLQFAPTIFGASSIDMYLPLLVGATICVPSQHDLMNKLEDSMKRFEVTFACMTPSAVSNVNPIQVPGLETLCLVGEPLGQAIRKKWETRLSLKSGYGLSEGVGIACVSSLDPSTHARNIGVPPVARIWLAEPSNFQNLAPVGSIGEMMIQGPYVGHGYLNDPEKTSAVFLKPPKWSQGSTVAKNSSRIIRTGDLARYQPDGSLVYVGRKDTQVKIRGKRVEVGEVEGAIRLHRRPDEVVIVEAACPLGLEDTPTMVCFIYSPDHPENPTTSLSALRPPSAEFQAQVAGLDTHMRATLPEWMTPSVYMPLAYIPKTASGKTDRRALRQLISEMTWQEMEIYLQAKDEPRAEPQTDVEKRIHGLFAQVLQRPLDSFGIHEQFLRLGGDSIKAIALVQRCKKADMTLNLAQIMETGTVSQLSKLVPKPWKAVANSINQKTLPTAAVSDRLKDLGVSMGDVEETGLCSSMQEGMLISQLKNPHQHAIRVLYDVRLQKDDSNLDIDRLKMAWKQLTQRHPMLRTIFVINVTSQVFAVRVQLSTGSSPRVHLYEEKSGQDIQSRRQNHRPPTALPQLSLHVTPGGRVTVELEITHAVTDGMSMSIITRDLSMLYNGRQLPPLSFKFSDYLNHQMTTRKPDSLSYWKKYLDGLDSSQFPTMDGDASGQDLVKPDGHGFMTVPVDFGPAEQYKTFGQETGVTLASVVKLAWSLVLRVMCRTDDVCFGYLTAARDAPIEGVMDGVGPLINLMICRHQFDQNVTVERALKAIQSDFVSSLPHRDVSLGDIRRVMGLKSDEAMFNTCITQFPIAGQHDMDDTLMSLQEVEREDPTEFDIGVEILVEDDEITSKIKAYTELIPIEQIKQVACLLGHALTTIISNFHSDVGDLGLVSDEDRAMIQKLNSKAPQPVNQCAHEVIREISKAQPAAQAVCAWDGNWTYEELDRVSSYLARRLQLQGVILEAFVPVLMEKSRWVPVVLLAILKSGGAFVLLDPSQPISRLQGICADLKPGIVVASPEHQATASAIVGNIITVSDDEKLGDDTEEINPPVEVGPRNTAYAVFTSGSTGKPKGVVIEHRSLCTTAAAMRVHSPMNSNTRMYQYASHAFDVSVLDLMICLMAGGCLCIPSAADRQNRLLESLNEFNANFVALTPTVTRTLQPERLTSLRTLNVGGEALSPSDVQRWSAVPHIQIINMYGPAECTINVTVSGPVTPQTPSGSIGYSMCNSLAWIVDPQNHSRLLPVGAVGELVIQGPVVSRGYLNRPEQTAESFVAPPAWLSQYMQVGPDERLYKTGDLVQYAPCGSLLYKGRKDFQVKLRGQRFELSEVEEHLRRVFPGASDVIAEVAALPQGKTKALAAFIYRKAWDSSQIPTSEDKDVDLLHPPCEAFDIAVNEARAALADALPSYMDPTIYLPLAHIPRSRSGKAERGQLRQMITLGLHEKWGSDAHAVTAKQTPRNEAESLLCSSVSEVIGLTEDMSMNENFFRRGGDSVAAMMLVGMLRERGYQLTVAHVFENPRLDVLATKMTRATLSSGANVPQQFALLGEADGIDSHRAAVRQAAEQCKVAEDDIEDIYPCSPLQHSFFLYSTLKKGTLLARFAYNLRPSVDLDLLRKAWDNVTKAHPQLRTRIIRVEGQDTMHQAVLRRGAEMEYYQPPTEDLSDYVPDLPIEPAPGKPLLRVALLRRPRSDQHRFLVSLQHSLYDGWSLMLLMQELEKAYSGVCLPHTPVSPFIGYLEKTENAAKTFWTEQLQDLRASVFPELPSPTHTPHPSEVLTRSVEIPKVESPQITLSTKIRWAWAQVISHLTSNSEVAIGMGTAGRGTPVTGIEKMVAPTMAIFPYRLHIDGTQSVISALHDAQHQYSQILPHEHYGNPNICRLATGPTPAAALQTLLIVQPKGPEAPSTLYSEQELLPQTGAFHVRALTLHCHLQESSVETLACYDKAAISEEEMLRAIHLFDRVFEQICMEPDTLVGDLHKALFA
ncbi:unnamed protein product [Penicillium olsonii]|nr:unnamed protein product [Penicillium olsonii]